MAFLIDSEKPCNKILHSFMMKALNKSSIEGMYVNMIKTICNKSTPNIIPSGEKLKTFPLRLGKRQGLFLPLVFSIVLEVEQARRICKSHQIGKEELKLFLFADYVTLYVENPKDATHTK